MHRSRSLIVTGVAFAALGFSFVVAANSQPAADGGPTRSNAAPGNIRPGSLVAAQKSGVAVRTTLPNALGSTSDPAALARLQTQKAILNAQGVTNLSAIGGLTIAG